jgi:hypothetical protein
LLLAALTAAAALVLGCDKKKDDDDGTPAAGWARVFGGARRDEGFSAQQTSDGGYIITGYTESFGAGGYDVLLIKTDASGNQVWAKTFDGLDWDAGRSIQQTSDGGYIIAGETWSDGPWNSDVLLIKTGASGDTVWTRTYGGTNDDCGNSVQQASDGGYIIAGMTSFGAGGGDVWLIKTDANGDTVWTRTYGGPDHDGGKSVQQTADGGYIIAGFTYSYGTGFQDAWLIKTDASGDTTWTSVPPMMF